MIGVLFVSFVENNAWAKPSVWKVSQGDDYIFIGGTVHILPPAEFPLSKEFDKAYKSSDSIVLEAKLSDASDSAFQMQLMQQMAYSNGKTMADFLSKSSHKQFSQILY